MKPPRLKIAGIMIIVAILATDLAVIRALVDGPEAQLLFDALPMVNILVFAGIAGFRRARAFTAGFVVVGSLSLLTYLAWSRSHPWSWLRSFGPPLQASAYRLEDVFPNAHMIIFCVYIVVVFAAPHTILGLAGGYYQSRLNALLMSFRN